MKKLSLSVLVFAAFAVMLCGCKGNDSKSSEYGDGNKNAVSQFDIKIAGNEAIMPETGEKVYCMDGNVEYSDGSTDEGNISVMGISVGDSLQNAIDTLKIKPGYAAVNYEYDPYGDGCTAMQEVLYDGKLPSAKELSVLDMALTAYYYFDDGSWKPIDLNNHKFSEYKEVFFITFDSEGVHDLYGQECGNIFSVEYGIEEYE